MALVAPHSSLSITGYSITELLYEGERTSVYRAFSESLQRPVVLKVLRLLHPRFEDLMQFRNQFAIATQLHHPNIVRPLALEAFNSGYVLVMPDEGFVSLPTYWGQKKRNLADVLAIAIQLAEALHYLSSERVIHKDIKPNNLVIHPDTGQVQLIDFGLSSLLPKEQAQLTNPNQLDGTLAYVSPEQTGRMNRGIDYRTDFYSLGVTLFELLVGELPFPTDHLLELVHAHMARSVEFPERCQAEIPSMVQAIIRRLMAKNAEDRYQSALGLQHDCQRCLDEWQATGEIDEWQATGEIAEFELGERDSCDRFLIPEQLYGRDAEVQTLLDAFDRVAQGSVELMLVAGFSGIGKTAVVHEIHKPITRQKGYFIQGKFDQFNRNIPFSAFVQAFRSLMRQLLGESDDALADWKATILKAVGDNGQVLIEVIPELERIIGPQPVVPELSGTAAQNRFNLLLGKFIQIFTTPSHPLVLFLDDLQWVDSASLNLLKLLMDQSRGGYLMILGAYRDNEVFPTHPLRLTLDVLEHQDSRLHFLMLEPLAQTDINQWVADTLLCSSEIAAPFSDLVYQKTQGNPFFTTQFLQGLHSDGQINFDAAVGYWHCNLTQIRCLALTDDVVTFMVERLKKLPVNTQEILKLAACVGHCFDLETLSLVCDRTQESIAADLWPALQVGLVIPESEIYKFFQGEYRELPATVTITAAYRFLHDRVQQAANCLIPPQQKQITHLNIGRSLLQRLSEAELEDRLFDVVNHWNIGCDTLTTSTDQQHLCQLNLRAGIKAKDAIAYDMAQHYAATAARLLGPESWQTDYQLTLSIHNLSAEAAYLNGDFDQAHEWTDRVVQRTQHHLDQIKVYDIKILTLVAQKKFLEAIALGRSVLKQLEIEIPAEPSPQEVQQALDATADLVPQTQIQALTDLPAMTEPKALAALQILNSIAVSVYLAQPQLFPLIVLAQVKLSILHGNAPISAGAYARYSLVLCGKVNDIETGYAFGQLALTLAERFNNREVSTRVLLMVGALTLPWQQPLNTVIPLLQQAYLDGLESGNLEAAALSHYYDSQSSYLVGQELHELEKQTRVYSEHIRRIKQDVHLHNNELLRQVILNLTEGRKDSCCLRGEAFDETVRLPQYRSSNNLLGLFSFHLHKLMLYYWFNQIEKAIEHAKDAVAYLAGVTSQATVPLFYFYDSLVLLSQYASDCDASPVVPLRLALSHDSRLKAVHDNCEKLKYWAQFCPGNFQHKLDLIEAEYYALSGQRLEAIESYDLAILGAKENKYIQEEALANELAAKFYLNWGREKVAAVYMQEAYFCYARWGAEAKTDDLEQRYRPLLQPILQTVTHCPNPLETLASISNPKLSAYSSNSATSNPRDLNTELNFAALLRGGQALSQSLQLDELLETLIQMMLQNSGADRLVLLLPESDGSWRLRATATPELTQFSSISLSDDSNLPLHLIQYVQHTQEILVVDDLETDLPILDEYLQQQQPRSVLCLPILYQSKLTGLLYLQNQAATGVFTHDRITILNFLCSQAASSIENSRLFEASKLAEVELQHKNVFLTAQQESSLDGMLVVDANRQVSAYNQRFVSLWNIPASVLETKDDRQLLECVLDQLENPRAFLERVEYLYDHPEENSVDEIVLKDQRFLERYSSPVKLPSGQYDSRIWYFRDISERKKLEQAQAQLNEAITLKSSAIEASDAGMAILRDGKYIYLNASHLSFVDYESHELLGESWEKLYDLEERERVKQIAFPLLAQQGKWLGELTATRKDGSTFPQEVSLCALEDSLMICICRDISDRKKLEQDQARLTAVLEATPDYIGICDATGLVIWCNQQLRELRPDLTNQSQPGHSRYYPEWVNEILSREAFPTAFEQGSWSGEVALLDADGNEIPVSQVIISHKAKDGTVETFSTIMRDISERKVAETALRESENKFRTLLSNLDGVVYRCQNDADGTMEFMSDAIKQLSGYPASDFINNRNRSYFSIIHPEDIELVEQAIVKGLAYRQSYSVEYRVIHRFGSVRWVTEKGQVCQNACHQKMWTRLVAS